MSDTLVYVWGPESGCTSHFTGREPAVEQRCQLDDVTGERTVTSDPDLAGDRPRCRRCFGDPVTAQTDAEATA